MQKDVILMVKQEVGNQTFDVKFNTRFTSQVISFGRSSTEQLGSKQDLSWNALKEIHS